MKSALVEIAFEPDASRRRSRVILVEDDPDMQEIVAQYLAGHGFDVSVAADRRNMARLLASESFDLMVLDLRLGSDDGLDLLRELRARSDLPVIIVTGHGRDEVDRVLGLELGADDYLTKPFSLRELLARIRVVLRRAESARNEPAMVAQMGSSHFAGWTLDRRSRRLTDPDGNNVPLTKGEYALLVALISSPGRPLSREQLLQATRVHEDIYDRSIDVQILRLRRKLEIDPASPTMIKTERGFGYRFSVPVDNTRPPVLSPHLAPHRA